MDAINTASKLSDAERIDRLRLIRSDNVGPRGIMAQTPPEVNRKPRPFITMGGDNLGEVAG
jgi:hypothetical protein